MYPYLLRSLARANILSVLILASCSMKYLLTLGISLNQATIKVMIFFALIFAAVNKAEIFWAVSSPFFLITSCSSGVNSRYKTSKSSSKILPTTLANSSSTGGATAGASGALTGGTTLSTAISGAGGAISLAGKIGRSTSTSIIAGASVSGIAAWGAASGAAIAAGGSFSPFFFV